MLRIRHLLTTALAALTLGSMPHAAQASAAQVMQQMEKYLWTQRVLVVFAPQAEDADYGTQRQMIAANAAMLDERDMVVWEVLADGAVRHNGAARPQLHARDFYEAFGVDAAAFTAILIGKDGEEKIRQSTPINPDTLRRTIDAMPMRQREMKN